MATDKEPLDKKAERLKEQFSLTDFGFDSGCIYQLGDLSGLPEAALSRLLPEHPVQVAESVSPNGRRFVATVSTEGGLVGEVFASRSRPSNKTRSSSFFEKHGLIFLFYRPHETSPFPIRHRTGPKRL